LSGGEATVSELAKPFDITMPAISKHLKVLERAGLVTRSREAQWRPCRLEAGPLNDVAEWALDYQQFFTKEQGMKSGKPKRRGMNEKSKS
jgi:DNA-binding transcriptional ArsR family regulator